MLQNVSNFAPIQLGTTVVLLKNNTCNPMTLNQVPCAATQINRKTFCDVLTYFKIFEKVLKISNSNCIQYYKYRFPSV